MQYTVCLSPSNQDENCYAYGNTNEAVQCQRIANACAAALQRCGILAITADSTLGMGEKCKISDKANADLHIPIHTNAGGGGAGGTRVFCHSLSEQTNGYRASQAILKRLAPITPGSTAERVSAYPELYEIQTPKAPTAYVEVDFHDVPAIAQWIVEHTTEIGEAICHGVCDYFNIPYVTQKEPEHWSAAARKWAVDSSLIVGTSRDTPDYDWQGLVTREQLVTVLYRFAQLK